MIARVMYVIVPTGDKCYFRALPPDQGHLRDVVKGPVQGLPFNLNNIPFHAVCNLEGKTRGLPFNRLIGHEPVAGTFLVAKLDQLSGRHYSPSDYERTLLANYFNNQLSETAEMQKAFGKWGLDLR